MTPEAALYLVKADTCIAEAKAMLSIDLREAAARTAYIAAFHAAQAFIFEHTGKVAKTHSGVKSEFHRIAQDHPRYGDIDRAFLGKGYGLKTLADYGIGPEAVISREEAIEALAIASRFVDITREVLAQAGSDQTREL